MRAHIVLDDELIDEIDEVAGKRRRSQFIEEAIREKLGLVKQRKALEMPGPALSAEDYPYWATPELTSQWVHDMRRADQALIDARHAERQREREKQGGSVQQ